MKNFDRIRCLAIFLEGKVMRKSTRAYSVALGILTAAMLTASGCGSSGSDYASKNFASESAVESYEDAGMAAYDSYGDEYYAEEGSSAVEAPAEADEVSEEDASSNKSKRKLITNISMSVETREFDSLMSFLKSRTDALGGYIESESINNNSYGVNSERYGHLTIRIPENKLDSFLTEVSEKSNITSQDRNVTDVTLKYADLESHKKALQAEQEQLLALMERAETIEEILQIQNQLTDVRYQLESMESQLRTYDNQVSYSTINMSINEVIEYTPDAPPTFGERARDGFMDNLSAVKDFFVELALAVITHVPVLVLLIIIVIITIVIVRAIDKRAKKKRMKKAKNNYGYPGTPGAAPMPNMPYYPAGNPGPYPQPQNPPQQNPQAQVPTPDAQAETQDPTKAEQPSDAKEEDKNTDQ